MSIILQTFIENLVYALLCVLEPGDTAMNKIKPISALLELQKKKKNRCREFPGGPVVRTPRFHCWGAGFNLWSGDLDL